MKPSSRNSIPFAALLFCMWLFSLEGCEVEQRETSGGCYDDSDCKSDRVCVHKRCVFAEQVAQDNAEALAERIFNGLLANNYDYFRVALCDDDDFLWGFQAEADTKAQFHTIIERAEDTYYSMTSAVDFDDATYSHFIAGTYAPVAANTEHALRDLDRLIDSRIVYTQNGQTLELTVHQLIRLRGRWRLFMLSEPIYE